MVIAWLNGLSLVSILMAFFFARQRKILAHKIWVSIAMATSFLLVLVFVEQRVSQPQRSLEGVSLGFKLFLGSHVLAAVVTLLLSLIVVGLALSEKLRPRYHRRWARVLIPIWVYSSVTGLLMALPFFK